MLGLGHHAPRARPTGPRAVEKLTEYARRLPRALVFPFGFAQRAGDLAPQPLVACETNHIVHTVGFAPSHQLLAAKARVAAQNDSCLFPPRANLRDDALDFGQTPRAGILVRRTQPRAQQMISRENVQRQGTVVVVVAMEKPRLLLAVQRRVGRV